MERIRRILATLGRPGAKGEMQGTASTMVPVACDPEKTIVVSVKNDTGYTIKAKSRMLDRWLDWVVKASGSEPVFFTIMTALFTWAFLGIKYGQSQDYQILISDVQAIVSYVFDSFLMRQQLNGYEELIVAAAELRSRCTSHGRMLRQLADSNRLAKQAPSLEHDTGFETQLPVENWLGRMSTSASWILGHIVTVTLFWVCILVWIGFGHHSGWSNMWQLYINSSTSALMVLVFSFLANIRERHSRYIARCLDATFRVDSALELKLRLLTNDTIANDTVIVPAPKVNRIQRAIYYYADVVGTLVGIGILMAVIVVWVLLGPVMRFDDNWWLLIGTYSGLVGMNDGFVLRNVDGRLRGYEQIEFVKIEQDDIALFDAIGVSMPEIKSVTESSLSYRASNLVGKICAHELMVVGGVLVIVGLLTGASVMRWSITGQLVCNVPPSIIESFFMIILITGHNIADAKKRVHLQNIYVRRLKLLSYVSVLEKSGECNLPDRLPSESQLVLETDV
jgi:low-affinity ferrous iron transport protein